MCAYLAPRTLAVSVAAWRGTTVRLRLAALSNTAPMVAGSSGSVNFGARAEIRLRTAAPATKHVTGSNEVRIHVRLDERSGRIIAIGVEDNLVKGAAGQAVQAFNLVHGLPETAGLEQLPLAP